MRPLRPSRLPPTTTARKKAAAQRSARSPETPGALPTRLFASAWGCGGAMESAFTLPSLAAPRLLPSRLLSLPAGAAVSPVGGVPAAEPPDRGAAGEAMTTGVAVIVPVAVAVGVIVEVGLGGG